MYDKKENPTKPPKTPKKDSYYIPPAIVLQSVYKLRKEDGDKYYPQIYLELCVYREKKTEKYSIKRTLVIPDSNSNDERRVKIATSFLDASLFLLHFFRHTCMHQ